MDKSIEYCRREMLCLILEARIKQILLRVTIFSKIIIKKMMHQYFFYCFDVRIFIQASLSFFLSSTYPLSPYKFESSNIQYVCKRFYLLVL